MDPIIASALKAREHIAAFDKLYKESYGAFDLQLLLVHMIDTVDASLLDILASEFDMLGYNGWILAETEQEKRNLLKDAISLHRMKGTPGGIREVIKRLGFTDIQIIEGWDNFSEDPAPENGWSYFKVVYVLPDNKAITAQMSADLIGLIGAYKNARSILAEFSFDLPKVEASVLVEVVTVEIE